MRLFTGLKERVKNQISQKIESREHTKNQGRSTKGPQVFQPGITLRMRRFHSACLIGQAWIT